MFTDTTDVLAADATDVLSADATDVMSAHTTHVVVLVVLVVVVVVDESIHNSKLFLKNSNFNWPGLGPVRAVPSVRAVPPSPGQLKFEFFTKKYLNRTQKIEKISKSF